MKKRPVDKLIWLMAVSLGMTVFAQPAPLSRPPQTESPGVNGPLARPPQALPPNVQQQPPAPAPGQPRPPAPAPGQPRPPAIVHVVNPEEFPNSMITVGRIRRLPANFTDVENLCWSSDGKKLLVDRLRRRTYELVLIDVPEHFSDSRMLPERIITEGARDSVSLHHGSPCWFPRGGGDYYLFTKQSPSSRDYVSSIPSNGWYCNLYFGWAGRASVPLTQYLYSPSVPLGVASPKVSLDGKTLFWCGVNGRANDRNLWGKRGLYVAGVEWNQNMPQLVNVRELGDNRLGTFRESCDISADGNSVLYCANKNNAPWFAMDVYVRNLKGNTIKCVAEGGMNRWACFSPKAKKIIWSSSRGFSIPNMGVAGSRWQKELRTELWLMTADGLDKRRLTFFNQRDSRDNLFLGLTSQEHCYVGAVAWHPNGRQVAAVIYFGARKRATSMVVLIDLSDRG